MVAEIESDRGSGDQVDVLREREIERLFEEVDRRLGAQARWVNPAGIDGGPGTRVADLEQAVNVIRAML